MDDYEKKQKNETLLIAKVIGGGILGLIVLVFILGSFGIVSAGEVGVKTRLGRVAGTIEPGLYFKFPIVDHVHDMDVQTQKEQANADAASSDLQTVTTIIAVNYNLDTAKVADLYTRIGEDYKSKIIDPAIQEVVKAVTAKYTAEQLITQRAKVTDDIQIGLRDKLSESDILVTGVSIVNFDFSKSFNEAIEAKVTAVQNAEAAKNKLVQVQFEAQQTVEKAKAQAESIRIQAQAVTSQGGADYVKLQAISKWDGKLPDQMIPNAAVPFIDLK